MDLWDERKDGCKLFISGMRGWRYKKLSICGVRVRLNGRGLISVGERKDGWKRMNRWEKWKDGYMSKVWKEVELMDEKMVGWKTVDL